MDRKPLLLQILALCILLLGIAAAGCEEPAPVQETGSVHVASVPAGAEVYLDNEYRGATPATIAAVAAGSHTVGVRMDGYEPYAAPVTVAKGSSTTVTAELVGISVTLPVTFATAATPAAKDDLPQIHVDGYWTHPQGLGGTANPVPLLVHTEAFNVGTAGAREVTVSAGFYYGGRQVCTGTVYLGTLQAGCHVSTDTMIPCTLPSGINDPDLAIRFENVVVTE